MKSQAQYRRFRTLLIANRGEIAARVIRTARAMGLRTVAVYSEADRDALHVEMADGAVLIGPPAASESYLVIDKIVEACRKPGRPVVVAENHTVIGGLGEAVAAALMLAGVHPAFHQIGLPDEFLAAGALPTLHDRYGISTEAICSAVKSWR